MNYLTQVQKGIDFIEANLDYDISLSQVAAEAGLSQWHFQRIFKALSNEPLKTYIRSRRLSNALNKLINSDQKIITIAIEAGFELQESFTRAFKKAFDITPNMVRKIGTQNNILKKLEFNEEYLKHINQHVSLTPDIYTQPQMTLVGIKTRFYSADSEKNNIADKLPALWDDFMPRMHEIKARVLNIAYGVIQQTPDNTDLLEYYAVCEVTQRQDIPLGMVSIDVPASRYAKFTHKGHYNGLDNTVNYIYSSWLLQSKERHSYGPDLEVYSVEYQPDSDDSIIYYAIPIN